MLKDEGWNGFRRDAEKGTRDGLAPTTKNDDVYFCITRDFDRAWGKEKRDHPVLGQIFPSLTLDPIGKITVQVSREEREETPQLIC